MLLKRSLRYVITGLDTSAHLDPVLYLKYPNGGRDSMAGVLWLHPSSTNIIYEMEDQPYGVLV